MAKVTERKCQACCKIQNRDELIKIVKLNNGELKINPNSKELGRSLYVCRNLECIKILIKKKRIKTALKFNDLEKIEKVEQELLGLFVNNN